MLSARGAAAQDPASTDTDTDALKFRAGKVEADATLRELTLERDVVITYGRYRLSSDRLRLTLSPTGGAELEGEGAIALCPCPDPPVTLAFSGARVEPPGDIAVDFPRVAIGGVPVLALPWIWLRTPDNIGLLPPLLAWRGDDGLVIGGGVHLPWRDHALQLRGAGYVEGGGEAQVLLTSPSTTTRVGWQEIHGRRAVVDAHGSIDTGGADLASLDTGGAGLAWDVDVARGDRARSAAPDLRAAVLPFDSFAAETSLRAGPSADAGGAAARFATGVIGGAERGEGEIVVGPRAFAGGGGPIGAIGTWEATGGGHLLGGDRGTTPFARAHVGAELDARPGPLDLRVSSALRARIVGTTSVDGEPIAPARDAMAAGRIEARLPLVRAFPAAPGDAPFQHWVVPVLEARAAALAQDGAPPQAIEDPLQRLARPPLRDAPPASWTLDAGLSSTAGWYAGPAASLDVRLGALGRTSAAAVRPAARARIAVHAASVALGGELGVVGANAAANALDPDALGPDALGPDARADGAGAFGVARARLGRPDGVTLGLEAAAQDDRGAAEARAISDGSAASLPGEELDLLAESGFSGAVELGVPWARAVRTWARVDADLTAGAIAAVQASIAYRHPCGCLGVAAAGAHRLGRGGVDIALSIELTPVAAVGGSGRPSLHSAAREVRITERVHQRPAPLQDQHPPGR